MTAILSSAQVSQVCRLSGVEQKLLSEKLITLRDLEQTLDMALRDAATAAKDEYFWRAMEVGAKLVGVTCDLTIAVLEDHTGPAGKGVSLVYDTAKLVVDGLNGDLTPQKSIIFSTNAKISAVANQLEGSGAKKYAKAIEATKTLLNLSYDLYDYWTAGGKATLTAPSGIIGARRTAYGQLLRIRVQVRKVEEELSACL